MRQRIILTLIIILVVALSGCGRVGNTVKDNGKSTQSTQQAGTNNEPQSGSPVNATGGSASNQGTGGAEIVAKSSNIVSSNEKEVLLNQVDQELDSLLNNINSLEDVQDSDLDLNQ